MQRQQYIDGTEHLDISDTAAVAADFFENSQAEEVTITDGGLKPLGVLERQALARCRERLRSEYRISEVFDLSNDFKTVSTLEGVESMLMAAEKYTITVDEDGRFISLFTKKKLITEFYRKTNDTLLALLSLSSMISVVNTHQDAVFDWFRNKVQTPKDKKGLEGLRSELLPNILHKTLYGSPAEFVEVSHEGREYVVSTSQVSGRGWITGAIAIVFDTKEAIEIIRKINALQQTVEEVNTIIETSYDGFTIADGDGVVIRVNKSHERITGSKPENMVGKHVSALVEDGQLDDPVTLKVLSAKKTITMKQKVKNGKQIVVTGTPVFDKNGNIVRVVCNLRDTSEFEDLQNKLAQSEKKRNLYKTELEHLRRQQLQSGGIFQNSESWSNLLAKVDSVAEKDVPVLILGETGVGKEVVAKLIHNRGSRRNAPFIKINCSAIPAHLIESELFGYEEGAFTGAKKGGKMGLFEAAGGGTIFLDEIGELTPELQVKMLEVLQDNEIVRVGGRKPVRVDARFVFATNRNLKQMVEQGDFREDLYFRLYVFPIMIPPLRNREDEIEPLAEYFLDKFNEKYGYRKTIHKSLMKKIRDYSWPGNVRELENYIERLVISSAADVIVESLDVEALDVGEADEKGAAQAAQPQGGSVGRAERDGAYAGDGGGEFQELEELALKDALALAEKKLIELALAKGGSMAAAADRLGVDRTTILRKISKYNIAYTYSKYDNK